MYLVLSPLPTLLKETAYRPDVPTAHPSFTLIYPHSTRTFREISRAKTLSFPAIAHPSYWYTFAANDRYTYVRELTDQGFRYLALVTDLYSRKIVGWDLSDSLSLEGALRAMRQAVRQRRHPLSGLIHHSDHGVQYASRDYLDLLTHHGIRSSMGRVGNAYDNAVAERVENLTGGQQHPTTQKPSSISRFPIVRVE